MKGPRAPQNKQQVDSYSIVLMLHQSVSLSQFCGVAMFTRTRGSDISTYFKHPKPCTPQLHTVQVCLAPKGFAQEPCTQKQSHDENPRAPGMKTWRRGQVILRVVIQNVGRPTATWIYIYNIINLRCSIYVFQFTYVFITSYFLPTFDLKHACMMN